MIGLRPPQERDAAAGARPAGPVLDVEGLHVTYGADRGRPVAAVRDVSFRVEAGEVVALVGESGSGKSSVARAVMGLVPPGTQVEGRASVLGVDMLRASEADRRRTRRDALGVVFQDPMSSLNPTMTVGRQLREVCRSAHHATELLEAVRLPQAAQRLRSYPHELSGGQRQRVMIALAIANDPALVVADEPTTALDVTVQAQVLALLDDLRHDIGCAFVLVTHDLAVASQLADRVVVCYGGRVAETGPAGELLARPRHPYTSALLRSRITLDVDRRTHVPAIPGESPDPRDLPPGCAFAPRCAHAEPTCSAEVPRARAVDGRTGTTACLRADELLELTTTSTSVPWATPAGVGAEAPSVLVEGVRKGFRVRGGGARRHRTPVLEGIDLQVDPGECLALVGESGCGKSTLLRIIAGLLPPDEGRVVVRGEEAPQMVFQDAASSLTPWLSIGEQIGDRLRGRGLPRDAVRERTIEALARVGLGADVARRRPAQLSGGQRQRAAIARSIVVPPPVLLCDEPTSSLDVSLVATVLNLLGDLRRELGMAMVFVTHDLAAARIVADRMAVMRSGTIIELGAADAVCAAPRESYTRALLASVPRLEAQAA